MLCKPSAQSWRVWRSRVPFRVSFVSVVKSVSGYFILHFEWYPEVINLEGKILLWVLPFGYRSGHCYLSDFCGFQLCFCHSRNSMEERTEIPLPLHLLCTQHIHHHPDRPFRCLMIENTVSSEFLAPRKVRWIDGLIVTPPTWELVRNGMKKLRLQFLCSYSFSTNPSWLSKHPSARYMSSPPYDGDITQSRGSLQRFPRVWEVFIVWWSVLSWILE